MENSPKPYEDCQEEVELVVRDGASSRGCGKAMRRERKHVGGCMLLGAFLMFGSPGHQIGTISGSVTDGAGAPIPGGLITATSESGRRSTYVDIEGRYEFTELAPGAYDLRAEIDVLAVLSNCPEALNNAAGFEPTPIRVIVYAL